MQYLDNNTHQALRKEITDLVDYLDTVRDALNNVLTVMDRLPPRPDPRHAQKAARDMIANGHRLYISTDANHGQPILHFDISEGETLESSEIHPIIESMEAMFEDDTDPITLECIAHIIDQGYYSLHGGQITGPTRCYVSMLSSDCDSDESSLDADTGEGLPSESIELVGSRDDWVSKIDPDGHVTHRYSTKGLSDRLDELGSDTSPADYFYNVYWVAHKHPPSDGDVLYFSLPGFNNDLTDYAQKAADTITTALQQAKALRDTR